MSRKAISEERACEVRGCLYDVLALLKAMEHELSSATGAGRDHDNMTDVECRGTSLVNLADTKVREALRMLLEVA